MTPGISTPGQLGRTLATHGLTFLGGAAVFLFGISVVGDGEHTPSRLVAGLALTSLANLIFLSGTYLHDAWERRFGRRCEFKVRQFRTVAVRSAAQNRRRRAWWAIGTILFVLFFAVWVWDYLNVAPRPF